MRLWWQHDWSETAHFGNSNIANGYKEGYKIGAVAPR
jgi:hypothetical protein